MYKTINKAVKTILTGKARTPDPVQWHITVTKGVHNTYKVHFTACIGQPWRLPSMSQQYHKNGGPAPTRLEFEKNDNIYLLNGPVEMGKLLETFNGDNGANFKYYKNSASFVQDVYVQHPTETLKGHILYMPYTARKSMVQKIKPFQIELD